MITEQKRSQGPEWTGRAVEKKKYSKNPATTL
jgi:hypothetical protein